MRKNNRNRIKAKGLMIVFLVSFAFSAVVYPCVCSASMWDETYGGAETENALGETVQAGDGGYAIFGGTRSFGAGGSDFWLIKIDEDGNMQWNQTYGGASGETSGDMCLTSDGGYALVGRTNSFGAGGYDFWLVKTDATGTIQWNQTYGGTGNEYAYNVIQTDDGGYLLTGNTNSFGEGSNDFWLVKTDGSGNMQWNQTYGGTGSEIGLHVIQTGDGGYVIAGTADSFGAGSKDIWLIETDSTGIMQWNQTYGGAGDEWGYVSLEQTNDGGFAIACQTDSFGAGSLDFWLVKTDGSGNMQWNQTYGGTDFDGAIYMIQTEDGGYALAGFTSDNGHDFCLVKTDLDGNLEWNMTYGGTGMEWAYHVIQTDDGGYLLTGDTNSFGAGNKDIWLVKTDEYGVIPEGLTFGVMLLLSTVATIVGIHCLRKRPKWRRR